MEIENIFIYLSVNVPQLYHGNTHLPQKGEENLPDCAMGRDLFQHLHQCPGIWTSNPGIGRPESTNVQFEGLEAVVNMCDTHSMRQSDGVDTYVGVICVLTRLLALTVSKVKDTSLDETDRFKGQS